MDILPIDLLQVAAMTCSFDGKYIFTAGGEDCAVNMWGIHTGYVKTLNYTHPCIRIRGYVTNIPDLCVIYLYFRALEAASLLGGENLQPFYAMLEGGRDGEFFAELEEYFYYAQIRRCAQDFHAWN